MNVRVEYEPTPIRHIAVQCPKCSKWFYGSDITNDRLSFEYQIYYAQFECPICGKIFGADENSDFANVTIKEVGSAEECYKGCLQRKEIWE